MSHAATPGDATAAGDPARHAGPGAGGPRAARRLGPERARGSRRRGALLRRLLALGDWVALIAALCVATAATSTTDIGTLFWAVLFSPVWILVVKLHGLYDNDHRRIRHSTLDELPSLVSASAPRHARPRRPAGAQPGRPPLAPPARSRSASAPSPAASSCAASCASSGTA